MNIHEYQAKDLFRQYGVKTLEGVVARNPDDAAKACKDLGGKIWVVKAQVHAGGRGKAGGVKLCKNNEEVVETVDKMIGMKIITIHHHQRSHHQDQIMIVMI